MRVALISDIHGNLHALQAVLEVIDGEDMDGIWCLGDTVGYGAFPNECVEIVRERADICLAGNHDLVAVGDLGISEFSELAASAARWTRGVLSEDSRAFLADLSPYRIGRRYALYHASPRDSVWEYVLSAGVASACFEAMPTPVAFVGHSHAPLHFTDRNGEIAGQVARDGQRIRLDQGRAIVNPGSVGQPRDGDVRASWCVLDTEAQEVVHRRIEYPVADASLAILEAGLPPELGERLYVGR